MTELIVFDWDGTLMDSEGRIVACLQQAARDLGYEVPPPEQAREVIGLGLNQAVARLFPEADGGGGAATGRCLPAPFPQ